MMENRLKLFASIAALLALSACGGAGGSTQVLQQFSFAGDVQGLSASDVDAIVDIAETAAAGLNRTVDVVSVAPNEVSYYGPIELAVGNDPANTVDLLGAISVDVKFDDNTVTGEAGSFRDTDSNAAATGLLTLENGAFLDAPVEIISGELRGTLNIAGDDTEFDLDASGIFRGDRAEVNGSLLFGDATVGGEVTDVSGEWTLVQE